MLRIALRRFWALAVVVAMTSMAAVTLYASRLPANYTATAVVSVEPRTGSPTSAALIALLSTKYVAYAASPDLHSQMAGDYDMSAESFRKGLQITMQERTTNIAIDMTARDRKTAAGIATAIGERIVDRSISDRNLSAVVVLPARPENASVSSGRTRLLAVGAAASAAFGVLVALLAEAATRLRARRRQPVVRSDGEPQT